jgi:4-aminobutyrate--pyruvate transaminase
MSVATSPAKTRDSAHYLHAFTNAKANEEQGPLVITRGDGVFVYDEDGNEYLEGFSGLWCASLGFSESRLVDAATAQMKRLPYYHSFFQRNNDTAIDLAQKLIDIAPVPMAKVFFVNSGSEATDTAVKLVWYYNNQLGRPEKKKIISRLNAYHGSTVAAGSLTGLPVVHRDFDLPIAGMLHTDFPHHYKEAEPGESEEAFATRLAESLEQLILGEGPDTVAAFIAEPIMGGGGVIVPPDTYFEKVQAVLRKYDILAISDEVICGFGRTGSWFGCQTVGYEPDIMVMAKGLTAAYAPLGAVAINDKIARAVVEQSDKVGIFAHGFTYSGHPVSTAVGLEAIRIYEERDIVGHVQKVGKRMRDGLNVFADNPMVGEVRGVGLMGAVHLVKDPASREWFEPEHGVGPFLAARALERGLIVRSWPDLVCLSPPLTISEPEVDDMLERFAGALDETTAWVRDQGLID